MSAKPAEDRSPFLSIIVVVYDMAREARRTLHSLTPGYQEGVESLDYEVIVVDNGSPTPLGEDTVRGFGDRFVYHYVEQALPSPCRAVNEAVGRARGSVVAIAIDGSRLLSPGLLRRAVSAFRAYQEPVVVTLSFELGSEPQQSAITRAYDKAAEDALLAGISWPANPYRLFDVAVLSTSAPKAPFRSIGESNCLFLRKSVYQSIGGMNERFDLPGGGLANLDLYARAVMAPGVTPVVLLGEGTFHQIHGGASTGVDPTELARRLDLWFAQYREIVGSRYAVPHPDYEYVGHVPPEFLRFLDESARFAFLLHRGPTPPPPAPSRQLRGWLGSLGRTARRAFAALSGAARLR